MKQYSKKKNTIQKKRTLKKKNTIQKRRTLKKKNTIQKRRTLKKKYTVQERRSLKIRRMLLSLGYPPRVFKNQGGRLRVSARAVVRELRRNGSEIRTNVVFPCVYGKDMWMGVLHKNIKGYYSFKRWNSTLNIPISKMSLSYYISHIPRNKRMRIPLSKT